MNGISGSASFMKERGRGDGTQEETPCKKSATAQETPMPGSGAVRSLPESYHPGQCKNDFI
jgi:hypothetical protein